MDFFAVITTLSKEPNVLLPSLEIDIVTTKIDDNNIERQVDDEFDLI